MNVLIVDDDQVNADIVAYAFKREGFQVIQARDGFSALECWAKERPELVIMEADLPGLDGFSVCQRIRKESRTPIIFLTKLAGEEHVLRGLELGADVYMTKPFSPRQLVARARAILRRTSSTKAADLLKTSLPVYPKSPHPYAKLLKSLPLAPLERRLLEYLVSNAGEVLSCDAIIRHVWGPQGGDRDTLRHLIRRLRTKIEPDPANPTIVVTVPGLGYSLEEGQELT